MPLSHYCSRFPYHSVSQVVSSAEPNTEHPIAYSPTLELNIPTPPSGAEVHRPLFGTGLAPPTGAVVCCPPICQGQECVDTRTLMRNLAADLTLLDAKVRFITQTEHHSSDEVSTSSSIFACQESNVITRCLRCVWH